MRSFDELDDEMSATNDSATHPALFPHIDWYEFTVDDDAHYALVSDLFNAIRRVMIERWGTYCAWVIRSGKRDRFFEFEFPDELATNKILDYLRGYLTNEETLKLLAAKLWTGDAASESVKNHDIGQIPTSDKLPVNGEIADETQAEIALADSLYGVINRVYWIPLGLDKRENVAHLEYILVEGAEPCILDALLNIGGSYVEEGLTSWEDIRSSPWPLLGDVGVQWSPTDFIRLLAGDIEDDTIKQSFLWTMNAYIASCSQDYKWARKAGEQAVALNPLDAFAWRELVNALYHLRSWNDAIVAAQALTLLAPENASSWADLAEMQCNAKQFDAALASSERAIEIDHSSVAGWTVKGWALHSLQRYESSIEACQRALELSNNQAGGAWTTLSGALCDIGRYDEALAASDQAIRRDGGATARNNRGVVLYWLKRYEEALTQCKFAIRIDPTYPNGWLNKGIALYMLERYGEAIDAHQHACELDPTNIKGWFNLGLTCWKLKRNDEALAACERALGLNLDYDSVWDLKGMTLSQMGRLSEACDAYLIASRLNPNDTMYLLHLGLDLEKLERYAEAVDTNQRLVTLDLENEIGWVRLSYALGMLSRNPESLVAAEHATQVKPDYAQGWVILAEAQRRLQRFPQARGAYKRAVELDSNNIRGALGLGWAYKQLGEVDSAVDMYNQTLREHPTSKSVLAALLTLLDSQGFHKLAAEARARYAQSPENAANSPNGQE